MMSNPTEDNLEQIIQDMLLQYTDWVNGQPLPWNVKKAEGIAKIRALIKAQQTALIERIVSIVQGNEVDVEATRKHMQLKKATEAQIFNMELEADDLKDTLGRIINQIKEEL